MPVYSRETKTKGLVWDVVVHANGKTIWRRGFKSEPIAKREETKLKASTLLGVPIPDERLTLQDFIEKRYLPYKQQHVVQHTYEEYRSNLRHVTRTLGSKRLGRLAALDIQQLLASLKAKGLGPTSIATILTRLRQVYRQAMRWELVYRNPAELVSAPQRNRRQIPMLSVETIRHLFDVAEKMNSGGIVYLAVATGMRWGELARLTWADVDEVESRLLIREAKTPSGVRSIAVGEETLAILRQHRIAQRARWLTWGRPWSTEATIFQTDEGNRLLHSAFWSHWIRVRYAAGLNDLHFHDLRHVQATLLVSLRIHPRVAQERLGHASSKTTMEIYSHVDADAQRDAAIAVEALLKGSG